MRPALALFTMAIGCRCPRDLIRDRMRPRLQGDALRRGGVRVTMTQDRPPERARPEPDDAPADVAPAMHAAAALQSLKQAMRRARFDDAERLGAMSDMRAARVGRLELLAEALQPLMAQIPEDVDLFDVGLMPGANPRLFLDMIGFVEMARDARTYRLIQDTRHGRRLIAESDSIDRIVDAATDYVARRLLERDKALAADADEADDRHVSSPGLRPGGRRPRLPAPTRPDDRPPIPHGTARRRRLRDAHRSARRDRLLRHHLLRRLGRLDAPARRGLIEPAGGIGTSRLQRSRNQ